MYRIDDLYTFETAEDAAQHIIENIDEDEYNDWLDAEGTVNVCGYEMWPSKILEECDPIAYRCGFSDYTDFLHDDIVYELSRMTDDSNEWFHECDVWYMDIDERRENLDEMYEEYNEMLESSGDDFDQDDFDSLEAAIRELEEEINDFVA